MVPTCGRPQCLANCLSSLKKQTILPQEVVVVDNSSSSSTRNIVKSFENYLKIVYVVEKRKGEAFARNKAIRIAQGDILVFIDDDCLAGRRWLEKIFLHFKKYPQSNGLVGKSENQFKRNPFAQVYQCFYWRWLMENFEKPDQRQMLRSGNSFFDTKNLALRKNIVNNFLFDKNVLFHGINVDIVAGNKLVKLGNFYYHPQVVVYHRNSASLKSLLKRNYYQGIADRLILERQKIDNRQHVLTYNLFNWLKKCRWESEKLNFINKIIFWTTLIFYPLPYKIGRLSYKFKFYR